MGFGATVTFPEGSHPYGAVMTVRSVPALTTAGGDYGYLAYRLGHRVSLPSAGLGVSEFWGPSLVLFGFAVLLFPDGRVHSRLWRVALLVYVSCYAAIVLATVAAVGGTGLGTAWPRCPSRSLAGVAQAALEPAHVTVWLPH